MKALIMSDTHGDEAIIQTVYERHKDEADLFIHCGDSELTPDHPFLAPFKVVKGNVDRQSGFPNQVVAEAGGLKWLVLHGHEDGVHRSPLNLKYKAESIGAQVVCFGHTHMLAAEYNDGKVYINPGSLSSPRDRNEKTYAMCEWQGPHSPFDIHFFTDQGEELKELSQSFPL
ncbi:metallophosphoesterase [Pullulanibacillus sp. KACC 23026]|uniref:metallophosphoesterase family protein n=1 Tax=Pullulanibacillus sp. KACC 23026 TaxID=3028315 RepID=UPI0023AE95A4|nr:metallophosphoesterase [Pullulanibacillus sp. KACC 23026]WEG13956.1 metallophosphoesterase [Pullulanibacillus sp. KACC 23026]